MLENKQNDILHTFRFIACLFIILLHAPFPGRWGLPVSISPGLPFPSFL